MDLSKLVGDKQASNEYVKHTFEMEGMKFSPEFEALMDKWVKGEITCEEAAQEIINGKL